MVCRPKQDLEDNTIPGLMTNPYITEKFKLWIPVGVLLPPYLPTISRLNAIVRINGVLREGRTRIRWGRAAEGIFFMTMASGNPPETHLKKLLRKLY